jgi:hypothetical protein
MRNARPAERGNVLFIILLAVALIGMLTAVISSGGSGGNNIDKETLVLHASAVQRTAAEMERGVQLILQNGISENDIRFAHPEAHADYGTITALPQTQLFHKDGGGVNYAAPPEGVNDGSAWEFYGGTAAPGVGTSQADLIAVLPNVTQAFCDRINETLDQTGPPADTGATAAAGINPGDCVHSGALGRFDDLQQFYAAPNTMDETSFAQNPSTSAAHPAPQGCVRCTIGNANHFYSVLIAR